MMFDRNMRSFDEYVASLGRLTAHVDPTVTSPEAVQIKDAAISLTEIDEVSLDSLSRWVNTHPDAVPAPGLTVGLSQEKLKNTLRGQFGSTGWVTLARKTPNELIAMLDNEVYSPELVEVQSDDG